VKGNCTNPSLLVLVAALNEEEGIGPTLEELLNHITNYHVLVVDGFSKDKTPEIARKLGAQVVYREPKGKGDALGHALSRVTGEYDYVVLIDADYTYPGEFVPHMIAAIEENPEVGMICGNRFNTQYRTEWINDMFYMGNRVLGFTHNLLNGVEMKDPLSGLRVVRWNILKNWKPRSKGFDIEVEMNHLVERQGYEIKEIDIPYRKRLGEKKLKARHGFQILRRMVADIKLT
jgi:glycosyltransferase involved in cell wall biosynthesis